jgi:hypothetical protein
MKRYVVRERTPGSGTYVLKDRTTGKEWAVRLSEGRRLAAKMNKEAR